MQHSESTLVIPSLSKYVILFCNFCYVAKVPAPIKVAAATVTYYQPSRPCEHSICIAQDPRPQITATSECGKKKKLLKYPPSQATQLVSLVSIPRCSDRNPQGGNNQFTRARLRLGQNRQHFKPETPDCNDITIKRFTDLFGKGRLVHINLLRNNLQNDPTY